MPSLRTTACAALLLMALAGCASKPPAQPVAVTCPRPPAPPAWLMQPPPNSLQTLERLISISEPK